MQPDPPVTDNSADVEMTWRHRVRRALLEVFRREDRYTELYP